jgi:hypothetical protein
MAFLLAAGMAARRDCGTATEEDAPPAATTPPLPLPTPPPTSCSSDSADAGRPPAAAAARSAECGESAAMGTAAAAAAAEAEVPPRKSLSLLSLSISLTPWPLKRGGRGGEAGRSSSKSTGKRAPDDEEMAPTRERPATAADAGPFGGAAPDEDFRDPALPDDAADARRARA